MRPRIEVHGGGMTPSWFHFASLHSFLLRPCLLFFPLGYAFASPALSLYATLCRALPRLQVEYIQRRYSKKLEVLRPRLSPSNRSSMHACSLHSSAVDARDDLLPQKNGTAKFSRPPKSALKPKLYSPSLVEQQLQLASLSYLKGSRA